MKKALMFVSIALCLIVPITALACDTSKGQVVYVSTSYNGDNTRTWYGTTRVLVRNPNQNEGESISVTAAILFSPSGEEVHNYVVGEDSIVVPPRMTVTFEVDPLILGCEGWPFAFDPTDILCPYDLGDGSRPSFVLTWTAEKAVCKPIVQGALFMFYDPWTVPNLINIVPGTVISKSKAK